MDADGERLLDVLSSMVAHCITDVERVPEYCVSCGARQRSGKLLIDHSVFDDDRLRIGVARPSPPQWKMLCLLRARIGRIVGTDFIKETLWPGDADEPEQASNIIKIHICRLRKYLKQAGDRYYIETCYARGFILQRGPEPPQCSKQRRIRLNSHAQRAQSSDVDATTLGRGIAERRRLRSAEPMHSQGDVLDPPRLARRLPGAYRKQRPPVDVGSIRAASEGSSSQRSCSGSMRNGR